MIKRSGNRGVYHDAVEYNGILYLAGVTADDDSLDMAGQTAEALAALDAVLAANGSSRDRILSATIFVTDIAQKPAMNEVWTKWLSSADLPARATIGVADLGGNLMIEIVATAARA